MSGSEKIIYEMLTPDGQRITGVSQNDYDSFIRKSRAQGMTIIKIKRKKLKMAQGRFASDDFKSGIEELCYLVNSGMKIDQAVSMVIKSSKKIAVIDFWEAVLQELRKGNQFSKALEKTGAQKGFSVSSFYKSLLSIGEETSDLGGSLTKLLEYLEFKNSLLNEVKSALAYPLFLIAVTIIALVVIVGVILPKFARIFSASDIEKLPAISRFVLSFGNISPTTFFYTAVGLLFLIVLIFFYSKLIQNWFKKALVYLPIVKGINLKMELANALSSLGVILNSGISISRALALAASVTGHPFLKSLFEQSIHEVKKGRQLSESWMDSDIIPSEVISMISVGEESVKLGDVFVSLGKRYLDKFKQDVSWFLTLLEPAVILIMGLIVGGVVTAVTLGVVSMNDAFL